MKRLQSRPRNPLVALARFRRAGVHDGGRKTERQAGQRALRAALNEPPGKNDNPDTRR